MQQKDIMKEFRSIKLIQLCVLLVIEVSFFLILILDDDLSNSIYTNNNLFILAAMMWGIMIFSLAVLFYDFYKLRNITLENHALNRAAYLDKLTGIPNRYSCDVMFSLYTTEESVKDIGCCLITINSLSAINDNLGHNTGDQVIQDFCEILEETGDRFGFVGRNSGNEFLAIIEKCTENLMEDFLEVLNRNIYDYNLTHDEAQKIEIRFAYILNQFENVSRFSDIITLTYKKLGISKD